MLFKWKSMFSYYKGRWIHPSPLFVLSYFSEKCIFFNPKMLQFHANITCSRVMFIFLSLPTNEATFIKNDIGLRIQGRNIRNNHPNLTLIMWNYKWYPPRKLQTFIKVSYSWSWYKVRKRKFYKHCIKMPHLF